MIAAPRNSWYVGAWGHEIGPRMLHRRLLDQDILFYRKTDGEAVAIGNRCPHRFAPLSAGTRAGDAVQCGYHGLIFGADGTCIGNPNGAGHVPPGTAVRAYPVVEQDALLWIWLGDKGGADPALIPALEFMRLPEANVVGEYLHVRADYRLISDNLMDLSHAATLHAETLGKLTPDLSTGKLTASQEGNRIKAATTMNGVRMPGSSELLDQWMDITWSPPGIMQLNIGQVAQGAPRNRGMWAIHAVTPETSRTSHYFFCNSSQPRGAYHRDPFADEDEPMLAACQELMGDEDFWELRPALLPTDAALVRVRRLLDKLVRAETAAASA